MFKNVAVLVGFAAVVVAIASPAVAAEPSDWSLENCVDAKGKATTKPESGSKCDLKNQKSGKCLVYTKHMGQVDWDFAACGSRNATLTTKGSGAIACGETFALKLGNEYFRKCVNPQTVGINICSESGLEEMHYSWQLKNCTGNVETGKSLALFNTARGDSVVFAKRPSKTVDTCWANSIVAGQCASARDQ